MASASQTILLLLVFQASYLLKVFANGKTRIIESFHVKSDIRYRFATTQVESVIRNVADKAQEIAFDVTLPKEAFVVKFSMDIDGKVYDGEVKERTTAKKQYQAAVDRGESAGHVRVAPRTSNLFEVSANVANGSVAKFTLTYQEMLHRKHGLYKHEVHVNLGQETVNDFLIEVFIQENKPLTVLKTPTLHKGSLINNEVEIDKKLTTIDRPNTQSAHITYKSSLSHESIVSTPFTFVVEYDVEHSLQGDVLVVDGYFVHFFSPDLPSMPKDIVFVLDVSGSMLGPKIQQLKNAMVAILDDLQPDDRFSIITFSSFINKWKSQLVTATKHNIDEAKQFIRSMYAEGLTDINSAILAGISELYEDNKKLGIIFFLTDGKPTLGVSDSGQIAANVLSSNKNISSIFGLAFGSSADYNLLTTISGQNSGFARKIFEDSDAALQVASLYEEISAVSVKDISINYLPSSVDEYTVTNTKFPVIFKGSEVFVSGKMADNLDVFQMEIKGLQKSGPLDLTLEVDDVNNLVIGNNENLNTFFTMPRDFSGIVEKMWAYITVKQYLKEKEILVSNEAKAEELKNKILQISLKYKFVTPLTSMVVTQPENPEKQMEFGLENANDHKQNSALSHHRPQQNSALSHHRPQQNSALHHHRLLQNSALNHHRLQQISALSHHQPQQNSALSFLRPHKQSQNVRNSAGSSLFPFDVANSASGVVSDPIHDRGFLNSGNLEDLSSFFSHRFHGYRPISHHWPHHSNLPSHRGHLIPPDFLNSHSLDPQYNRHHIPQKATQLPTVTTPTTKSATSSGPAIQHASTTSSGPAIQHASTTSSGPAIQHASTTSSGPAIQHATNIPSGFHVSAIVAKKKDLSICLAPKHVKEGKYKLIQSPDGSELIIQTACSGRKCKKFLIKSIILKSKGNSTEFSVDENENWVYQDDTFYSFTKIDTNTIKISVKDFEITVATKMANGSLEYVFSVELKFEKGYGGLIGKILNMSAKKLSIWHKAKVPDACIDKDTDFSKSLSKIPARYRG